MFIRGIKWSILWFVAGIFLFVGLAQADTITDTKTQLEQELEKIEQQIAQYTTELGKTQTQKATLANKISQLQSQQKSINLQIKATSLKLDDLSGKIMATADSIELNTAKEKKLNQDIATILRQMNFVNENIFVTLASADGLSGAFDRIKNYLVLTDALGGLLKKTQVVRGELVTAQTKLEEQKSSAADLLKIKSIQQQSLSSSIGEQGQLLAATKGKESSYQTMLSDSKKRAAEIRSRIYELFNTGKQINFGQAVDIAKWVSGLTGVRPAFLLAILTQESNLGKNVGTCNRSGDPATKSWKVIMKPERDQEPFKQITSELGLDIDTTPVSCPMRDKEGNQVGWGGAMGPAQFIPSTWMGYRSKVTKLTGNSTANPWDIRDAFLASGIKLRGDGADGTEDGDFKAAMRYFAGSVNLKYRFYGDNVLAIAKRYEQDIADL